MRSPFRRFAPTGMKFQSNDPSRSSVTMDMAPRLSSPDLHVALAELSVVVPGHPDLVGVFESRQDARTLTCLPLFAAANRKAGHSRARVMLVFGRKPGGSDGFQGKGTSETEFKREHRTVTASWFTGA